MVLLLGLGINGFAQTQVPNATLTALNGKSVKLNHEINKDKVTIISFWATWCIPCINELNAISEVYEQWQKDANVELIAVSIDDARTQKRVKPLVNGKGWKYKVFIDKNQELKRMLNISSVPYLIVVKNGKIIYNHSGYSAGSENELYEVIKNTEHKSSALDNLSVGFESNMQYYVDDKKTGDFKEDHRFRSNNYLKVNYNCFIYSRI
ncbi:MAG: thiol:disulfide interchange protein [Flavobacteriales bacterium]|nr:MAG: thiol:disulfide interchange protein [Flavobacteriales bacterium]